MHGNNILNSRRLTLLALLLIVLFNAMHNYYILEHDKTELCGDMMGNFYASAFLFNHMPDQQPYPAHLTEYPPLLYYATQVMFALFGVSEDVAVMTNAIFLFVLVFGIYSIGFQLRDRATGLLAAFLVTAFNSIIGFSRLYMIEFALTAMVALSIGVLLRTRGFSDRKYSAFFGIVCGLGLLTKWSFGLFIIGPALYSLLCTRITGHRGMCRLRERMINLAFAALIMALLASLWYPSHIMTVAARIEIFSGQRDGPEIGAGGQSLVISWLRVSSDYLYHMFCCQLGPLFFVMSMMSLFFLFRRKYMLIHLWFTSSFFIFTVVSTASGLMSPRFVVPYLPSFAVLVSLMIQHIRKPQFRKSAILLVIAVGLGQVYWASYHVSDPFAGVIVTCHDREAYGLFRSNPNVVSDQVSPYLAEAMGGLENLGIDICLFLDSGIYHLSQWQYYVGTGAGDEFALRNLTVRMHEPYGQCGLGACILDYQAYADMAADAEIVLIQDSVNPGSANSDKEESMLLMHQAFNKERHLFTKISAVNVADATVEIYRKSTLPGHPGDDPYEG
ncbi:MAG: glycosyltransferase family 39 protein [archaeon]